MRPWRAVPNWVWLVLTLGVVGVIQVLSSANNTPRPPLDPTSATPNGALALNLWLQRVGYRVHVTESPSLAGSLPSRGTLMLLAPQADPGRAAESRLRVWVRGGGRLVIISDGSGATHLLSVFGYSLIHAPSTSLHVVQPLLLSPPTARLDGAAATVLAPDSGGIEAAGTAVGPVVARERLGQGVVWLVSSPDLLANSGIAAADNRRLALNLAGRAGSRVELDEITLPAAAQEPNSSGWLTSTAWGVVVLFLILITLLYRGLAGRRLGAAIPPHATSFRPAVEYVVSMAGLLRRGQKQAQALLPYQRSLRRLLDNRGMGEELPRIRELLEPETDLTERELIERAAAIVGYEDDVRRNHG